MSPAELVAALADAYADAADAARAEQMSAYLREQFTFHGIPAKARRPIDRGVAARGPGRPTHHYLVKVAKDCWDRPQREFQYFAVDYLRKHHRRLDPPFADLARELVVTRSWWDTVDALAAGVIGPFVRAQGMVEVMDTWIVADDPWVVRAALLHQLAAKEDTDAERLFTFCLKRADDTDVFVRKAIGWSLRQHARTDPVSVRRFLDANGDRLSPMSVREATRRLPRT